MSSRPKNYYHQSAVIPYRFTHKKLKILLITSRTKKRWVIPKGLVEIGMTARDSAAMEALEEAGIKGKVSSDLVGIYKYKKWGGVCRVQVYSMKVKTVMEYWDEDSFRERQWVSVKNAIKLVDERMLRIMIKELSKDLEKRSN